MNTNRSMNIKHFSTFFLNVDLPVVSVSTFSVRQTVSQSVIHSVSHEYIPCATFLHANTYIFTCCWCWCCCCLCELGLKPMATWSNFLMLSKLINFTEKFFHTSPSLRALPFLSHKYRALSLLLHLLFHIVLDFSRMDHRMNNVKRWTKFESSLNKKRAQHEILFHLNSKYDEEKEIYFE